jgi:5-formyltetrahydrofolate cyclo-ligase
MTKDELRKIYISRRLSLSLQDYQQQSEQISNLFFETNDFDSIQILHLFLPIESKREPDTWLILNRIQNEFPNIQIVIPRVAGEKLEHLFFENKSQLKINKWGIWEPTYGVHANPLHIDQVLVPLLAYDERGHRIGYGRGYYDRFFKTCKEDCIKTGLSFFGPEKIINERLEADVMLNNCITPLQKYSF